MGRSYFPNTDSKQSVWAANYRDKIESVSGELGLTPEQVDKQRSNCEKIISAIGGVAGKRSELSSSIGFRNKILSTEGGALRADISNIKTLPGYTDAIGRMLGVVSTNPIADFATFKPVILVESYGGGMLRIRFKKMETDGINIYRRKKNTVDWFYLARANKSPYDQTFTLEVAGQPELWEYRAFGVVDDMEIGLSSDIVQVVYAV